jgi:hypothetical protein
LAAWDHDEAIVNLSFQSTTEIVKDLFANNNQALIEAFQVTNFIDQMLFWDFLGGLGIRICASYFPSFPQIFLSEKLTEKMLSSFTKSNSLMMKLPKTLILPNCQVPNVYFLYDRKL